MKKAWGCGHMRQCLPIKVDRGGTGPDQFWTSVLVQGGVTPIDSIVTAAAALVNPYTKEEVESLHILPYTSVNVRIVNWECQPSSRLYLVKKLTLCCMCCYFHRCI